MLGCSNILFESKKKTVHLLLYIHPIAYQGILDNVAKDEGEPISDEDVF